MSEQTPWTNMPLAERRAMVEEALCNAYTWDCRQLKNEVARYQPCPKEFANRNKGWCANVPDEGYTSGDLALIDPRLVQVIQQERVENLKRFGSTNFRWTLTGSTLRYSRLYWDNGLFTLPAQAFKQRGENDKDVLIGAEKMTLSLETSSSSVEHLFLSYDVCRVEADGDHIVYMTTPYHTKAELDIAWMDANAPHWRGVEHVCNTFAVNGPELMRMLLAHAPSNNESTELSTNLMP